MRVPSNEQSTPPFRHCNPCSSSRRLPCTRNRRPRTFCCGEPAGELLFNPSRLRIRSHSDNPVVTIISLVLAVLIVGGGILVRYAIFKATQRNSTPPTAFNGPNGPQYGVTGSNYGTPGTGYGTAGTGYGTAGTGYGTAGPGYGTAGTGYGTAADAAQPGSPAYGTGAYGNQQGVQGPYGTGF